MVAVWQGRTEVVSLLLEAGANTDLQNEVRECVTHQVIPHPRHTNVLSVAFMYPKPTYDPLEHS